MAGTQQDTAFRRLIDVIFEHQRVEWAEQEKRHESGLATSPALETKKAISTWRWKEINESKLQSVLSQTPDRPLDFERDNLVMFLPPFPREERSFVPAMSLYYNANQECLNIRTVMIDRDENGHPYGFGFRLEAPTSNCVAETQGQTHEFYHVQLIKELGYGPELHMPDWLPCTQPAFPIRADDPASAVLSLILGLYGLDYFRTFLNKHITRIGNISPLLKDLASQRKRR